MLIPVSFKADKIDLFMFQLFDDNSCLYFAKTAEESTSTKLEFKKERYSEYIIFLSNLFLNDENSYQLRYLCL